MDANMKARDKLVKKLYRDYPDVFLGLNGLQLDSINCMFKICWEAGGKQVSMELVNALKRGKK